MSENKKPQLYPSAAWLLTWDDKASGEKPALMKRNPEPSSDNPFTYLVILTNEPAFKEPAEYRYHEILSGMDKFNPDNSQLIFRNVHNVNEFNALLKSYRNIYHISIYAHSFYGSEGFTFSMRDEESEYNVSINKSRTNATHVSKLAKPDMNPDGAVFLYSCHAVDLKGNDITEALARHFGVPVHGSPFGLSLWPPGEDRQKTRLYANPKRGEATLFDFLFREMRKSEP